MQAAAIYAFGDIDVLNFEDVTYGSLGKAPCAGGYVLGDGLAKHSPRQ